MIKTRKELGKFLVSIIAVVSLCLGSTTAVAIGLQVSPMSVELPSDKSATEMWLINSSNKPMQVQLRVYQWEQKNNQDVLEPTSDLLISPPVTKIAPQSRQLVRIMRPKKANSTIPLTTFRILANELPLQSEKQTGVDFVMEYSVPVFVYNAPMDKLTSTLTFKMVAEGKNAALRVTNQGDLSARLYNVTFINRAGKRTEINSGLVGYVLPNKEMQWSIDKPANLFAQGGTLELLLNGKTHTEPIEPISR